jgi:hypothetical protein
MEKIIEMTAALLDALRSRPPRPTIALEGGVQRLAAMGTDFRRLQEVRRWAQQVSAASADLLPKQVQEVLGAFSYDVDRLRAARVLRPFARSRAGWRQHVPAAFDSELMARVAKGLRA